MLRKVGFLFALTLTVPAIANAWTLAAKVTGVTGSGSITASGTTVTAGSKYIPVTGDASVTAIAPAAGYKVSLITVDGVAVKTEAGALVTTAPITITTPVAPKAARSVVAYFSPITYTVTVNQSAGGAVTAQMLNAAGTKGLGSFSRSTIKNIPNGGKVRITAFPNSNAKVLSVAGVDKSATAEVGAPQSVDVSVAGNATYDAVFAVIPTVSASLVPLTADSKPIGTTITAGTTVKVDASGSRSSGTMSYAWSGTCGASGTESSALITPAADCSVTVTVSSGVTSKSATLNFAVKSALQAANAQCATCHLTRNPETFTAYAANTHGNVPNANSYACNKCHSTHTLNADVYEAGQTTAGVNKAAGYVGAQACAKCHGAAYEGWSKTSHNKPLKSVAVQGAAIFKNDADNNGKNDFEDGLDLKNSAVFKAYTAATRGGDYKLSAYAGKFYMKLGKVKYEVVRTQGGNGKWKQRYHTKIGNAYYLLPLQYNEINRTYEAYNTTNWFNATSGANYLLINGVEGDTNETPSIIEQVQKKLVTRNQASNGPSAGSWDNRCAACHQTGVSIEFTKGPGSNYAEVIASSADLNIGCESCHGPGATHVAAPAAANIKNPANWANAGAADSNYYRANEVCGQCHSRTEGFAHFSTAAFGKVVKGIEAPSLDVSDGSTDRKKAQSYTIGQKILDFIEKNIPTIWKLDGTALTAGSTTTSDGSVTYEDGTTRMHKFSAGSGHHQQWHDMENGAHGAGTQMSSDNKLTCFSCHDPHNPNSSNIRASITKGSVTIPTASEDNTLCLACHAGFGDFAGASVTDVATAPMGDNVKNAVYNHMVQKGASGKGCVGVTPESWKGKYLTSVQRDGKSATFGIAVYKVGQCVSCHMPFTAKSAIWTSTTADGGTAHGRQQGDQRAHTMKPIWPGLTNLGGGNPALVGTTVVTSCSACHAVTLAP